MPITENLEGKIALVTGAGRGIGLGCAKALAEKGATLVLNDRPGSSDLDKALSDLRQTGAECTGIEADVFSRRGCQDIIDQAERIDILVSNPAFTRRVAFLDMEADLFDETLRATLTAGFHMGQLVAKKMIEQGGGGKMIFVSSVHGQIPLARAIAYNAGKAGLEHMVRSMAVELLPHRINVNAIAPGWIDTPGERTFFTEEQIAEGGKKLPWGRLGRPEEIGYSAAFLASAEADYITGVVLHVDGGFRYRGCGPDALPLKPKE